MKVYVYPMDVEGCGYYRLIWPSLALKKQGYDVKVIHPSYKNRIVGEVDDAGVLQNISAPKDADVIVLQRVTSKVMYQAVPMWRRMGIAVVHDLDDDLSVIDPNNPAWNILHPTTNTEKTAEYDWHAAQKFSDAATYVTTSTLPLLKKYAPHGRGQVLYNCVPEVTTKIEHKETHNLVGWSGNARTHPNDPHVLGVSMARIQRDGFDFRVVGPSVGVKQAFTLDRDPQITGGIPLGAWHHEIAKLSVGVAPLAATKFNTAKSWLKMLEYAAVGVPAVGSPRAEYRRLQTMGIGLLADSPKDWYRHVRRLLGDDVLRAEMSEAGRAIVREKLTIEANAWRWWEAWQTALRIQRGGSMDPFRRPVATTTGTHERGPQAS